MKFSQWFAEMDSTITFPDPKKYYLACVLDVQSQKHLIGHSQKVYAEQNGDKMIPKGWIYKAHHMTIKFKLVLEDFEKFKNQFGQDMSLHVRSLAWDGNCIAAVVDSPIRTENAIPHITIAHSNNVSAEYSNTLLSDKQYIRPNSEYHTQLGSVFVAVLKFNQSRVWPEKGFPLAAPSLVT